MLPLHEHGTPPPHGGDGWPELFHAGRRERVDRGCILLQPGDCPNRLYFLHAGRVSAFITWHDGSEKILALLLPGSIFGETFFFRPESATASFRAECDSVLYSLSRAEIWDHITSRPALASGLLETMAGKIGFLARQVEDLRFRSVESRLANLLYTLAVSPETEPVVGRAEPAAGGAEPIARGAEAVARGTNAVTPEVLSVTHSVLADLVGAHRVTVSSTLKSLEKRGLIALGPRKVAVKDLIGLYHLGFGRY